MPPPILAATLLATGPGDESALLQTYVEQEGWPSPFPWASHKLHKLGTAVDLTSPKLVKVSINSQDDLKVLGSAVITVTLAVLLVLLLFCVLRRRFPLVYAGRAEEASKELNCTIGPGLLDWIGPTQRLTAEQVQKASTLDHTMLVQFCRLCMNILFTIGVPLVCLLCPLHALAGGRAAGEDKLSWIGFANVERDSWLCCVHSLVVWVVVYITMKMVYTFQEREFLPRRFDWLRTMPTTRATTIMVESIPEKYRTDEALKAYFSHVFEGHVQSAWVVKRTRKLVRLLKELHSLQDCLKAEDFQWEKVGKHPNHRPSLLNLQLHKAAPRCPENHRMKESTHSDRTCSACGGRGTSWASRGGSGYNLCEACHHKAADVIPERLDALNYYEDKIEDMEGEISAERARILQAARGHNEAVYTSNGFVTFDTRREAALALQVQYMQDEALMVASIPPAPGDVLYEDLQANDIEQESYTVLGWIAVIVIFWGFMPVVLSISAFSNMHAMSMEVKFLRTLSEESPIFFLILDGILGSLLLMIFIDCMPTVLNLIFYNFFKLKSTNWAQLYLQKVYFWFLLVFVVLVEALGGSLAETVLQVLSTPSLLANILAEALPFSTHFYMKYLVLQWIGPVLGMLRIMQLPKYLVFRAVYGEQQAKVMSEPEDQDYYGMGARSARFSIDMAISVIFSSLSPLIVVIGFINLAMRYIYIKYLVVFAETRKDDSGGAFWVTQLEHLQFGLLIYITLQVGVLAERSETRFPYILTMPAYGIWLVMFIRFKQAMRWESLPFEELVEWKGAIEKTPRGTASYEQPELFAHEDHVSQGLYGKRGRWIWQHRIRDPVVAPLMHLLGLRRNARP